MPRQSSKLLKMLVNFSWRPGEDKFFSSYVFDFTGIGIREAERVPSHVPRLIWGNRGARWCTAYSSRLGRVGAVGTLSAGAAC